ncbi:MAG: cell division protein FtsL [Clostridia bacterium]|nr:cell division protein FtsL [Clostridia bacterium]
MAAENAYKYEYAYGFDPAYAPERQPEKQPEKEKRPDLKTVKKRKEDIDKQNERVGNRKFFKIFVVLCVFFGLFAVVCDSFAMRDEAKKDLDILKDKYVFVEAENRELKVQLNNLISAENIDRIAVEKLGLVKVAAGNEIYLDDDSENQVIYSKGK